MNAKKGMERIQHDSSNEILHFFFYWQDVGIFKSLSITKIETIFEAFTDIGNTFHDFLQLSFYHNLCTEFRNECPHIFIFINIVLDTYRVYF